MWCAEVASSIYVVECFTDYTGRLDVAYLKLSLAHRLLTCYESVIEKNQ